MKDSRYTAIVCLLVCICVGALSAAMYQQKKDAQSIRKLKEWEQPPVCVQWYTGMKLGKQYWWCGDE